MELEPPVPPVGRIGSESGPPNLATETNASRWPRLARNPPSPVRVRRRHSPKTPRKRGTFWDGRGSWARSLCNRRLGGGAGSLVRTRLSLLSSENTGNSTGFGAIGRVADRRNGQFPPTFGGISLGPRTGNEQSEPPEPQFASASLGAQPHLRLARPGSGAAPGAARGEPVNRRHPGTCSNALHQRS